MLNEHGIQIPTGVAGFYGRLSPSGIHVFINNRLVYNNRGQEVGTCDIGNRELHLGEPGTVTNEAGRTNKVSPIKARRSKSDEMWHRWACMGRCPDYLAAQRIMAPPLAIIHASPSGARCRVQIESIYRPSTNETITFTSDGIVVTKGKV